MRKSIVCVAAIAALATTAVAAPPEGVPFEPIDVNVLNTPLSVDVPERVIDWAVFSTGGLQTIACDVPAGVADTTCEGPVPVVQQAGLTIRGVMFMPKSLDTALSEQAKAGSCEATYWLSTDGVRYVRFVAFAWSPTTIASQFIALPVAVRFPEGAMVHQRLVVNKRGGAVPPIACALNVKSWAIQQ
jgi:hypothetical protein